MAPHNKDFDFKLTSDVKIRQLFKNTGGEDLFLPLVTLWSRSTSNFFNLIGRKSDFGWHHFRCTPCLMRKSVEKASSDSGLTDSFQQLHLKW